MAHAPSIEGSSPTEPDDPDAVALSPLIIAGAPRSGTSWLQKLILAHPQCTGGQESHLLVLFAGMLSECRRKAAFPRPHGPLGLVTEEEFIRSLRETWARVFEPILDDHPQATLLVEKTPDHILHLELADRLLPNCRVVHLVRHPAEVAASLVRASREPWGRGWAPGSIEAATRRWLECAEAGTKAATRLGPGRFKTIRYEDLRADPRQQLQEILAFAGIESTPELAARIVENDLAGKGASIPLRGDLGNRPLIEPEHFGDGSPQPPLRGRDLRRCLAIAGPLMPAFGYDPSGSDR